MTVINRGFAGTVEVEWRLYAGGPYVAVTTVTITITSLATNSVVLATTATGVTNPATGINAYVWTPSTALPVGDYLITWAGVDPDSDPVGASEIVTVVAGGALGGPYADAATLKKRMSIPDANTSKDAEIADALLSASDTINLYTGRQFGQDTAPSPRTFEVGQCGIDTADFWTTTGLIIDGTAYDATVWRLLPLDGVVDGVPGWPYRRLESFVPFWPTASQALLWPYGRITVTVTAAWGWAQIPAGIRQACLLLAADDLKSADAPFGVAAFGDYVTRVRANPRAAEKLDPYMHPSKRLMVG